MFLIYPLPEVPLIVSKRLVKYSIMFDRGAFNVRGRPCALTERLKRDGRIVPVKGGDDRVIPHLIGLLRMRYSFKGDLLKDPQVIAASGSLVGLNL